MRILLLGDASNYHASLAEALRRKGHFVVLASEGSQWMETRRDIDISRRRGRLGGAWLYLKLKYLFNSSLRNFDIVQLASPNFASLKPSRLKSLLKTLKRNNSSLYLTCLGTDSTLVRNLCSPHPALGYSEWSYGAASHREEWLAEELTEYTDFVYANMDGAVSALYEYDMITCAEWPTLPIHYAGIPIAIPTEVKPKDFSGKIKILYAVHRGREAEKGADKLMVLLARLQAELPDKIEIVRPANVPYNEFLSVIDECHMVCDQLYSYTPATTALLAMARGVVPITGGEEEFYRFIDEPTLRPIFNPDPSDLEDTYQRLKTLVQSPDELQRMSTEGVEFVARHNADSIVAERFIKAWTK